MPEIEKQYIRAYSFGEYGKEQITGLLFRLEFFLGFQEQEDSIDIFFNEEGELEMVSKLLSENNIKFEILSFIEDDWTSKWKEYFKPIEIASLGVRSSDHPPFSPKKDYEIVVEVEQAFGVGTHETTYLCLKRMMDIDFEDLRVLDLGCGTSILAMLADMKNAKKVYAVDNDPLAIDVSAKNLKINQCKADLSLSTDSISPDHSIDIIIANIQLNPLKSLRPEILRLGRASGRVVFSGLLHTQREEFLDFYSPSKILYEEQKGEWILIDLIL